MKKSEPKRTAGHAARKVTDDKKLQCALIFAALSFSRLTLIDKALVPTSQQRKTFKLEKRRSES